jgi:hypothetical protein
MQEALQADAEFCAHVVSWNHEHGSVRDAKVALPVYTLATTGQDPAFIENALAHLALLNPIDLERAWRLSKAQPALYRRQVRSLIEAYLRAREADARWWTRTAIQFRRAFKALYALSHVKPSPHAQRILFEHAYPPGSVFKAIATLQQCGAAEIAQMITRYRLPYLVVSGALGKRIKEPELLLELVQSMTPAEVVTNSAMLKRFGVLAQPTTRAAYETKLAEVMISKKTPLLKTTRAADAVGDPTLAAKLQGLQERQLNAASGIEGNWLILGDRSPSMAPAIEYTRQLAAVMARMVRGHVHVVFFDAAPRYFEATGLTYDELREITKSVQIGSGTSIGCGVQYALERQLVIDGITIVSDGGENAAPAFTGAYAQYARWADKEVPVYFYRVKGDDVDTLSRKCYHTGIDLQIFDVDSADFYSLPTLIQTMRTQRYSLSDEIFATPLKTVAEVLKPREIRHAAETQNA